MAEQQHWSLLKKAAVKIRQKDVADYIELRRLLPRPCPEDRDAFKKKFAHYYRMNSAGLTQQFKKRYFEILFASNPHGQEDPYTDILLELYRYPRLKGDFVLQASFVSKLVGIHDESRPLYDRHVSRFFGLSVPSVGSVAFRIAGFVRNIEAVRAQYLAWASDSHYEELMRLVFAQHPALRKCHLCRVCDYLVWSVGVHGIT